MTQPTIRVERTVEWPDTDAAGHYHHSSVIRWVEAAESELHLALGLPELFGHVPRVHYEVDYLERLWFRDKVVVELRVGPGDMGRVIGRGGRVVNAMRSLVQVAAARQARRGQLEILE